MIYEALALWYLIEWCRRINVMGKRTKQRFSMSETSRTWSWSRHIRCLPGSWGRVEERDLKNSGMRVVVDFWESIGIVAAFLSWYIELSRGVGLSVWISMALPERKRTLWVLERWWTSREIGEKLESRMKLLLGSCEAIKVYETEGGIRVWEVVFRASKNHLGVEWKLV